MLRVFSRDVVLGGIAFVGRENVKNILKTNEICYCLGGGEIQNYRGEIPPKGPEKNTADANMRGEVKAASHWETNPELA